MSQGVERLDLLSAFEHPREALFRYYDTPFGLANGALEAQRRELLDRDRGAWRRPLLEVRPRYRTVERNLRESLRAAGAHDDLAAFAELGLLEGVPSLYTHQHHTLIASVRDSMNPVITAGTGSGKTESFVLPICAGLLRESDSWRPGASRGNQWWRDANAGFGAQRQGEQGRSQGVRALILYPMNALVEDQMVRLRHALDSDPVRAWLDANRHGHRFYFGRYTSSTPVSGDLGSSQATERLRDALRKMEERALRARVPDKETGLAEGRYFVPSLDGAEMPSRWDMIKAPPDIMITNYSMLNVMLQRSREEEIFEKTRHWLERDSEAVFTLVVDELHTYRGTAGTEVAYLIRNLKHRLGLDRRPEQFRAIAASASLEPDRDRDFLQEFFDVPKRQFVVLGGELVLPDHSRSDISPQAAELAQVPPEPSPKDADSLLKKTGLQDAIVNALREGPRLIARSDEDTAARLFPKVEESERQEALRGALAVLRQAEALDAPKLRGHLFFRDIPGIWACTDPECPVAGRAGDTDRTVGRLYAHPTSRCECGARVLELLYCQNCGDVFLGGYAPQSAMTRSPFEAGLLPELPDLDKIPDQASVGKSAANYIVYWPRKVDALLSEDEWSRSSNKGTAMAGFAFKRSRYNPKTGLLQNQGRQYTGWSFHVSVPKKGRGSKRQRLTLGKLPATPTQCPACGDNWENQGIPSDPLSLTDPKRMRTPVRPMRTGFEKINQVLTTALLSPLASRKAVVFADSRQNAAKLSAGLGLRHYQDLLRLCVAEELHDQGDPAADVAAVEHFVKRGNSEPDALAIARAARERLETRNGEVFTKWYSLIQPNPLGGEHDKKKEAVLRQRLGQMSSIREHARAVQNSLLLMGVNPGGPKASLQRYQPREGAEQRWAALFDWEESPVSRRTGLSEGQDRFVDKIEWSCEDELLDGLFASAGRDFESLGLGWLCLASDRHPLEASKDSDTALVRSSLRVLGQMRRFFERRESADKAPRPLQKFWDAAAERLGVTPEEVRARVEKSWGTAVVGFLIDPSKTSLRPSEGKVWICARCKRVHLHPGVGSCTKCRNRLPVDGEEPSQSVEKDYYAWMAREKLGKFRLNCAELTGQTDLAEAQSRQARFQGIFLETGEDERTDSVDLLSVTTTMEAGVDIGPLSVVIMANMPPTRFNYQQRVGRAGRRGTPMAVALTVCGARSHDAYYFDKPERITNDPTPAPYLSTDMRDIYRRVFAAEVLRRAFRDFRLASNAWDPTINVHGEFGRADEWTSAHLFVQKWVEENGGEITEIATALNGHVRGERVPLDETLFAQKDLVGEVDEIAREVHGHEDLSQRLAEAGMLPMFGFPTSVRYLYTSRPKKSADWPPRGAVDREMAIAVSQFAPGAETVRDGYVHTAAGVIDLRPAGPKVVAGGDPLGPSRSIGLCRACGHVSEDPQPVPAEVEPVEVCGSCGAAEGAYRTVPLREPLGFFAPQRRDFDGNFSFTARSLAPRTASDLTTQAPQRFAEANMVVHSGKGTRYSVNDNGGQLFRFLKVKANENETWVGGLLDIDTAMSRPEWLESALDDGEPQSVAIGARQWTDLFLLGPAEAEIAEQGLRLNLAQNRQSSGFDDSQAGRRAAWYSLAALLRKAASAHLQIQPNEIDAGIHGAASSSRNARVFAFLSDALDNGAGYCTHLAEAHVFRQLLAKADELLDSFSNGEHGRDCRSSCPQCLQDYSNMLYHSLLDWRLGGQLLGILRGELPVFKTSRAQVLLENWASDLPVGDRVYVEDLSGTGPCVLFEDRTIVAAKHPFEAADAELEGPRIKSVRAAAMEFFPQIEKVVFVDDFELDRIPSQVTVKVIDFAG